MKIWNPRQRAKRVKSKMISHTFGDVDAFDLLRALTQDVQHLLDPCDLATLDGIIRSRSVKAYIDFADRVQQQLYLDTDTERLEAKYMVSSILKRFQFRKSPYDKRGRAIEKWRMAENACRRTNRRLEWYLYRPSRLRKLSPSVSVILAQARAYVATVLGSFENFRGGDGRHGPGSSLCTVGDRTTAYYKHADFPYTVTDRVVELARSAIGDHHQWFEALLAEKDLSFETVTSRSDLKGFALEGILSVVESNRLTFVEKDAKTLRPIAIEPRMNLYLQLGVHDHLVRRMKKFGVNLSTGQSRNQKLARKGSISNSAWHDRLATIDLSSASDSVSYELVRWMLPPDWFNYLDLLRCPKGQLDGEEIVYEKFSSMGNGFTFALESLLFLALTRSCMKYTNRRDEEYAIYGDDIICPVGSAAILIETLKFVGFSVNTDKTFLFGEFRESCGKDYHRGTNIRPLFVKSISDIPAIYGLLNRILALTLRSGGRRTYYKVYGYLRRRLSSRWLLFGPVEPDPTSSHIHAPFWLFKPGGEWDRDLQGWRFRSIRARPNRFSGRDRFRHLLVIMGVRMGEVTRRDNVSYAVTWSLTNNTTNFGWCPAALRYFT